MEQIFYMNMTDQSCDSPHLAGFVQERHNSIANALELRLSYTHPLIGFTQANINNPLHT